MPRDTMSRLLPYSPMHGPEKHVTQEDMWETLKKHVPSIDAGHKRESPKEKPATALPPLVWQKPVKTGEISGFMLSEDRAFSVSKDSVRGAPMYTAWKCRWGTRTDKQGNVYPKRELPETNLGVRLTLAEARHLCELAR